MKTFRNINWAKTDIITPSGELLFSKRFVMVGQVGRVVEPPNKTIATVEFTSFWYHEGSTYRGETPTGEVWEILKLRCNCRS